MSEPHTPLDNAISLITEGQSAEMREMTPQNCTGIAATPARRAPQ